jgi:hypothetical protein
MGFVKEALEKYSIFLTSSNVTGIGAKEVLVGDGVVHFNGAASAFVLRKRREGRHELIGNAQVLEFGTRVFESQLLTKFSLE